jgi:hypothetical protein
MFGGLMNALTRCLFVLALIAAGARADQEARNLPIVKSGEYGRRYAKSIPDEGYGQKGETHVYRVEAGTDVLECSYDWFSGTLYLGGIWDMTLVRFGPWHRGREVLPEHLAIGIYRDGKTIREYSCADMIKAGSGMSQSVSHYRVFGKTVGFRRLEANKFVFEVEGASRKLFAFDLDTGEILNTNAEPDASANGAPRRR